MTLSEAIESKRGLPYQQILTELQAETKSVLGAIRGDNLRNVVAMLAGGLQYRLESSANSPYRTALLTGFHYMAMPDYAFNLAADDVMGLLQESVSSGLVTNNEFEKFIELATYSAPLYPDLKMLDIVTHFEPELVTQGDWLEVPQVERQTQLRLRTLTELPEPAMVRIEMSESDDGINWTEYKRVNHFYGVHKPGFYFATVPFNDKSLQRRFRVRGETYNLLNATVKAV